MFHRLLQQAQRAGLASEPGYQRKRVAYALDIEASGQQGRLIELGEHAEGAWYDRCPHLTRSELAEGGQQKSQFLVDALRYLLVSNDSAQERARRDFFVSLLHKAGEEVAEFLVCARYLELEDERLRLLSYALKKKLNTDLKVTLWLDGQDLLAGGRWENWWKTFRARPEPTGPRMRDLITGRLCHPAVAHPSINGLSRVGGLTIGDSLVSFGQDAFQSYGLKRGQNAAMSEASANLYVDLLTDLLLSAPKLANFKVAYWYDKPQPDDPIGYLLEPDRLELSDQNAPGRYQCMCLSGSYGRVMIRYWGDGSVEQLRRQVRAWYQDRELGSSYRSEPHVAGLSEVLESLPLPGRPLSDPLALNLFASALQGEPIAAACQLVALKKAQSDVLAPQGMNGACVGLLKASLIRDGQLAENRVDRNHADPAYHFGRRLALLAQMRGNTVWESRLALCLQAPGRLFAQMEAEHERGLQDSEYGCPAYWFRWALAEVRQPPPQRLSHHQKMLFCLGYYQQFSHRPGHEYQSEETTQRHAP